jgi:glycosyltransferase involved in cell wall biosynthesis
MKNKILIFNTLYPPEVVGGAELSVQSIAESISEKYDVTIVSSNDHNIRKDEHINNIHVIRVPAYNFGYRKRRTKGFFGKIFWNIFELWNPIKDRYLFKIIDQINPDIIHTNNLACLSVGVWKYGKNRNIPVVHTLRDKWLLCSRHHMFKYQKICSRRCFFCKIIDLRKKLLSSKVDYVVGISEFILKDHLKYKYFKNVKNTVIYNGVDNFIGKNNKITNKNKTYNLKFGFLGSISDFKGIEFLLINIVKINTNFCLYIGGDIKSIYAKNLKKTYEARNIKFLGRVTPEEFFKKIDLLVVPSLFYESFGRIVIESFQQGVPVLASCRGALPEIVKDGVTGWIFDPDIEGDLVQKINRICKNNTIKNFRENCLKEGNKFTVEIMKEKYLDLYEKILYEKK